MRFKSCGCSMENFGLRVTGRLGCPGRDAKSSEVQILQGLWQGKLLSQTVPCVGERSSQTLLPLDASTAFPVPFLKVTGEIRGGDQNRDWHLMTWRLWVTNSPLPSPPTYLLGE